MINILPVIIKDEVTGLKITIQEGPHFNKIHIEYEKFPFNRDFYFTKLGEFDGTGASLLGGPMTDMEKDMEEPNGV